MGPCPTKGEPSEEDREAGAFQKFYAQINTPQHGIIVYIWSGAISTFLIRGCGGVYFLGERITAYRLLGILGLGPSLGLSPIPNELCVLSWFPKRRYSNNRVTAKRVKHKAPS